MKPRPVSRSTAPAAAVTILILLAGPGCSRETPPPTAEEAGKVMREAGERIQSGAASAAAVAREAARDATQSAEALARRAAEEARRAAEAAAHSETAMRLKSATTNALQQVRTQAQAGAAATRIQAGQAWKEASELASQAAAAAEAQARKLAEKAQDAVKPASPPPAPRP